MSSNKNKTQMLIRRVVWMPCMIVIGLSSILFVYHEGKLAGASEMFTACVTR